MLPRAPSPRRPSTIFRPAGLAGSPELISRAVSSRFRYAPAGLRAAVKRLLQIPKAVIGGYHRARRIRASGRAPPRSPADAAPSERHCQLNPGQRGRRQAHPRVSTPRARLPRPGKVRGRRKPLECRAVVPSEMTPKKNVAFRPGASGNPGGAVPSARNPRRRQDNSMCPPARVCFESCRVLLACPVGGPEPGREDSRPAARSSASPRASPRAS